jgi:hypothetical protein
MKKKGYLILLLLFSILTIPNVLGGPKKDCDTILEGEVMYSAGHYLAGDPIPVGYDEYGYNYQSHMFNSYYCNAYLGRYGFPPYEGNDAAYFQRLVDESYFGSVEDAEEAMMSEWYWSDTNLIMKWNDSWLSNMDCGTQVGQAQYTDLYTPDGNLDRHYPYDAYIGSGAWLTNHMRGEYWCVKGDWEHTATLDGSQNTYDHAWTVATQEDGEISGTGRYLGGPQTWTFTGTVKGNSFTLIEDYEGSSYFCTLTGTIAEDGTISGTWEDSSGNTGTWMTTKGQAVKVKFTYFVKIIAVPDDAYTDEPYWPDYGWTWYSANDKEIGKQIWGSFAVIQQVSNDKCLGEHGVIYNPVSPTGFGYYKP